MVLSTDLDCSGGLPGRVPSSRKLSQAAIVSYGQLCRGEWEARVPNPHRPHDVTNQSLRLTSIPVEVPYRIPWMMRNPA